MDEPANLGDLRPTVSREVLHQAVGTEFRVFGVVEDDVAVRQEMRLPRIEVSPNTFVGVVAVEPQERYRLPPSGRQNFAADVEEANVFVGARPNHVAEERGSVLGTELAAEHPDEGLVRLHGVDGRTVTGGGPAGERNGRATSVTADLDDAAVRDPAREVVQQDGGVAREPPLDRPDVA
jgi:hypothetical protein